MENEASTIYPSVVTTGAAESAASRLGLFSVVDQRTRERIMGKFASYGKSGGSCAFIETCCGRIGISYHNSENSCDFCRLLRESFSGEEECRKCDTKLARTTSASGYPAVYLCHAGMIDYQIPLHLKTGECVGTFVGGQFASHYTDTFLLGIRRAKNWIQSFAEMPVLTEDLARNICNALRESLLAVLRDVDNGVGNSIDTARLAEQIQNLEPLLLRFATPSYARFMLVVRQWIGWQSRTEVFRDYLKPDEGTLVLPAQGCHANNHKSQWISNFSGRDLNSVNVEIPRDAPAQFLKESFCTSGFSDTQRGPSRTSVFRKDGRDLLMYGIRLYPGADDSELLQMLEKFADSATDTLTRSISVESQTVEQNRIPVVGSSVRDDIWSKAMAVECLGEADDRYAHWFELKDELGSLMFRLPESSLSDAEESATCQVVAACGAINYTLRRVFKQTRPPVEELAVISSAIRKAIEVFGHCDAIDSNASAKDALEAYYKQIGRYLPGVVAASVAAGLK